jgi:hypothetical protein
MPALSWQSSATAMNVCQAATLESGLRGAKNGLVHLTLLGCAAPFRVIYDTLNILFDKLAKHYLP